MAKVIFGNHSSVIVPLNDRDSIRKFYCDVLGGQITKGESDRDFLRLGDNFYIVFLYGDVPDESQFLRTARSVWLEIKSDNVEEMRRNIIASGLVRKLDMPDPHLYFQTPGGQVLRLVGIDEDLSFYEGAGDGPNVAKVPCSQTRSGAKGSPSMRIRSPASTRPANRRFSANQSFASSQCFSTCEEFWTQSLNRRILMP